MVYFNYRKTGYIRPNYKSPKNKKRVTTTIGRLTTITIDGKLKNKEASTKPRSKKGKIE